MSGRVMPASAIGRLTPGRAGVMLLAFLALVALAAPLIAPFDPGALAGAPFLPPGPTHWLGTDDIGHDIFSALIYGARISLGFGITAAVAATAIGTAVGVFAGFVGGPAGGVLMRIVDVVLVLPFLPLLLVVGAFFGSSLITSIAVVVAVMWARPARELRAQVLSLSQAGHVQAAIAMGAPRRHSLLRHVLPGVMPIVVPQFVQAAKVAILAEASLSFLGLGDPTVNSWGTLLYHANARGALLTRAWVWWGLPPGLCLGLAVLAFALTGYAIEERARPRLRRTAVPLRRNARQARTGSGVTVTATDAGSGSTLLDVRDAAVSYSALSDGGRAVDGVTFSIERGEIFGLVGASGSGKTTMAHTVLGMLPDTATVERGSIVFDAKSLLEMDADEIRKLRGNRISLVPQSAMSSLDPVMRVGPQIVEAILAHRPVGRDAARADARTLLEQVDLRPEHARSFPGELSGGMRQRVVIAMALANDPLLVVADEPTTGLDVIAQAELIRLLRRLSRERGLALLLITHDIAAALSLTTRLAVMRAGRLVEQGPTATLANNPQDDYTRQLISGVARIDEPSADGAGSAAPRAPSRGRPMLQVTDLCKDFPSPAGGSRRVLDAVTIDVQPGEIVGLVGRSGEGKTTLARIVMGLETPDRGSILVDGRDITKTRGRALADLRRRMHLVFQDAYDALPPHWRVRNAVAEPLRFGTRLDRKDEMERVRASLAAVSLAPAEAFLDRFPHELSGGERQRVALARALIHDARLIVADEPTSLLDVPLRAELLRLMAGLRDEYGIAYLYITHDLALAREFCDRIAILGDGRIVEEGDAADVIRRPRHPRTLELVRAGYALSRPETE